MLHVTARAGNRVTARLPEDVDLHTAPLLRAVGDRVIDEGCRHLTLDASRTSCMDSSGVTLLITWYQRLDRLEGTVELIQVSTNMYELLHRLGLHTAMTITPRTPAPGTPGP
ncbi:STAS domain-containing protein [Streptomyces sp. NPDC012825]|uniref:STAS domain-containing protein n=1 Tax=Streptomyces sp. NPDC012825 TaxID=3364851 RepID=UPI0036872B75